MLLVQSKVERRGEAGREGEWQGREKWGGRGRKEERKGEREGDGKGMNE